MSVVLMYTQQQAAKEYLHTVLKCISTSHLGAFSAHISGVM